MYIKRYSDRLQVVLLDETRRLNMYKSFKKWVRCNWLCFLCWVEHLPLLCGRAVVLPVAGCQLPADVALNKLFKAVITLTEQILQVPAPRLGLLKHTQRKSVTFETSEGFYDQSDLFLISELRLMHIKLHVKSIIKAEPSYLYGIEVHVLSPGPTLIKRENINIHCQPTGVLNLTRSLLDVAAGPNQEKVRVLLNMMKTTSHAAPINNKMSFCINVSSMKDTLITHWSPCLACKSINKTGCSWSNKQQLHRVVCSAF